MNARPAMAADLGRHLIAEITRLIDRHARLAQGGGASAEEWSAAMMIAVDRVILHGLASFIVQVPAEGRGELLDAAMLKVAGAMFQGRETVLLVAKTTDRVVGR